MKTYLIKAEDKELADWKEAAARGGSKMLAPWIRTTLNKAVMKELAGFTRTEKPEENRKGFDARAELKKKKLDAWALELFEAGKKEEAGA